MDKNDAIFEKVEQDRHISSYDVAGELGIDHKTVLAYLKKAGYTKKLDIWVPHELTERNLMNRVLICDSLLRRNETKPFLKKLITGDEKWITYDKKVRKRSWLRHKAPLRVIIIYLNLFRVLSLHNSFKNEKINSGVFQTTTNHSRENSRGIPEIKNITHFNI
ncbi:hypothetical protein K1T71_008791 [Dendrolimus kikuchii]|uniref:Uncharacterized protein n=1 Tax=Dendrolimus kikuchii TaxID=765133 RepID=A0ACC1CWI5_9NEOP|nr:hypothetical protein K1T71_008791 [Dendrolimus kikuchii]